MLGFDPLSLATAGFLLVSSSGCPAPAQNPAFALQIEQLPVTLNQSLSAGQITQLKLSADHEAVTSGDAMAAESANRDAAVRQAVSTEGISFYNGLTQGQLSGTVESQVVIQPLGDGQQSCLYAEKVTLALTYDPTVYVAAEYATRPCANQVVTAHENTHVERDLAAIADFTPRAKLSMQEFLDGLGGQGPYAQSEVQDGMLKMRDTIQGDIDNAILPGLSLLRTQYQQGLDTPENYKRQSALCPAEDWLPEPPGQ
jgi:hypothetical protein